MRILGIGLDIVETARMASAIAKYGDRFLEKVFLPDEIAHCKKRRHFEQAFGVRFAAKEAVSKAFGTGINSQMWWQDIEVRQKPSGEPFIVMHGKGAELAQQRGVTEVLVSLTHSQHYAVAQAIVLSA